MNRMTSDNTFEMNMIQRALNQVHIGKDGWEQYVEQPDLEYSVCDLIRTSAETLGVEIPILGDEVLADLLVDWLQYGVEEPEGILAILYRALCAMAALRAKLYRYEDTGLEPEQVMEQIASKPNEPPALSRGDNTTDICPDCGMMEALAAMPRRREEPAEHTRRAKIVSANAERAGKIHQLFLPTGVGAAKPTQT